MIFHIYDQVIIKPDTGFWKNEPGIITQILEQDVFHVYLYRWDKDPIFRKDELRLATEQECLSKDSWNFLMHQIKECKVHIQK